MRRCSLIKLPNKQYDIIYADPPWTFETWSKKGEGKSASQHYNVMTLEDICNLPVADIAAKDCCLFLWGINSMLPQALQVITAWGFIYKTVAFNWIKTTKEGNPAFGMGYWTRQSAELCLLATRGKPKPQAHNVRQTLLSPRREHSRKPDEVRTMIERLAPGENKIELFARQHISGWDTWGNEVNKFDEEIHYDL